VGGGLEESDSLGYNDNLRIYISFDKCNIISVMGITSIIPGF